MGRNRKDISQVILEFEVDERQLSNSLKAADAVLQRYKSLSTEAGALRAALAGTQQAQTQQATSLGTYNNTLNATSRAILAAREAQEQVIQTTRRSTEAIEENSKAYQEASTDAKSFGQVSTSLNRITPLLSSLGLGGVANIGGIGADIANAVQGIGQLGPALQTAIRSASGLEVSLGAVGVAGGVAGVAIAGIALALTQVAEAGREASRGVQAYITATERYRQEEADLTEDRRQQRLDELNRQIQTNTQDLAEYQHALDQLTENTGVFAGLVLAVGRTFDQRGIPDLEQQVTKLQAAIEADNQEIGRLSSATADAAIAANEAAQKEADLAQARRDAAQATANAAVAAARERDSQAARDYAQNLNDVLDAQREAIQFERQLKDLRGRSSQQAQALRDQSADRVQGLRDQFAKAEDAANKAIAKVQTDSAKKRAQIERDYMQKSLDDTRQYLEKERRANENYARDRVRLIEDINDDLLSAEEDNNIIRFIQIQRQGQKDLRRLDENASVDEKRRSEDFKAEQEQRKDEAAVRLHELRNEARERINEIRQGLREQRRTLDEQINQESQALKARLELNRQALLNEIQQRRRAHQLQLAEDAYYASKRAAIEQQLQSQLLAIAQRGYTTTAKLAASKAYGNTGATLSSYLAGRTLPSSGGSQVLFNFSNMQVGSQLSTAEVQTSLKTWGTAIMGGVLGGLSGKSVK